MLGRVGVARETDREAPSGEQPEQLGPVRQIVGGHVGIEIGLQRDVQNKDDQLVVRDVGQHIADEDQLVGVEFADVGRGTGRPFRVRTEVFHVVEHDEDGIGIAEGVVRRTEDALEGLAAVAAAGRLEVEIVVAADVVPGNADRSDDPVQPIVHRQVVEHDVAGREAELGGGAGQGRDDVLADEIHLGVRFGLRVGEEDDLEALRLLLARQREIDGGRQGAGRGDPLEGQPERGGRSGRLVDGIEARQHGDRVDGRHKAGWLDDEENGLVGHGQGVAAIRIGERHVAAVRHHDTGYAGPGAADGFVHLARSRSGPGPGCGAGRRRTAGRRRIRRLRRSRKGAERDGGTARRGHQDVSSRQRQPFVVHVMLPARCIVSERLAATNDGTVKRAPMSPSQRRGTAMARQREMVSQNVIRRLADPRWRSGARRSILGQAGLDRPGSWPLHGSR